MLNDQGKYIKEILSHGHYDINDLIFKIYAFQGKNNLHYQKFLTHCNRLCLDIANLDKLVFFPVTLFKDLYLKTGNWQHETHFLSSGTTGKRSRHLIRNISFYHKNCQKIFEHRFGPVANFEFVALLPHYQDNPQSSLISMVDHFMASSGQAAAPYFDPDSDELMNYILSHDRSRPVVLFGVSFGLMEFAQNNPGINCEGLTIIETGGMKRFGQEKTREEIYTEIRSCFIGAEIHSEYGMTECLSQAYTNGQGRFEMNDRFRVVITEPNDPFSRMKPGQRGRVNIIDLANIDTLSFLATDDLGIVYEDQSFEILGRMENSDLRGCNYLI